MVFFVMSNAQIVVDGLSKIYHIPVRGQGLGATLKGLIKPVYQDVKAVENLHFQIAPGEVVGFIGPNGAGKTTTLKMLSGLLHPTSGQVRVASFTPHQRQTEYLKQIAMVMGNKSQLNSSITVADSFYITKEIYGVCETDYRKRLNELVELLEIGELLPKLGRNLSLGERAKCEFTCALLYGPRILFLDEPTLGMDVTVQLNVRSFIKNYNREHGTTILMTSHYMGDIASLCPRVMVINHGSLLYDGNLEALSARLSPYRLLKVTFEKPPENLLGDCNLNYDLLNQDGLTYTIRVSQDRAAAAAEYVLNRHSVKDLSIEQPSMEEVIDQVYRTGEVTG